MAPSATVGSVVPVVLRWIDPDLPAGTVATSRAFTEGGGLGGSELIAATGACSGGGGAGGELSASIRFAAAGTQTVTFEISTCGGQTSTFKAEVTVAEPTFDGKAARSLVARVPGTVNPEVGTWRFTPDGGSAVELAPRDPAVAQFHGGLPATVLVIPAGAEGAIRLTQDGCDLEMRTDAAVGGLLDLSTATPACG